MSTYTKYQSIVGYLVEDSYFNMAIDLGCGKGDLGSLVRSNVSYLVGVDHNEGRLNLVAEKGVYDKLLLMDVRDFDPPPSTDIVFMLEVIEHLSKEDGGMLLSKLQRVPVVIMTTPDAFFSISLKNGHVSHWSAEDFSRFGYESFLFRRHPLTELMYGKGVLAIKAPDSLMRVFRQKLSQPRGRINPQTLL